MTAVLVHGVPETPALWDHLIGHLSRTDIVTPALPGFTTDRPKGFGATMDDYAAWLIAELEAIGEPVDLVGHDWGGGFTVRVVSLRPDLVRSWVTDAAGLADINFEWHSFAKIWQTPDEGEAFWQGMLAAPPSDRAAGLVGGGMPQADALVAAEALNPSMASCILDLYRSATKVQDAWGGDFVDIPKPGMVIVPSDDAFLDGEGARRAAAKAGARVTELAGLGHWWMLQDPLRGAEILEGFWSNV
jgi:pimeloyl-ACP methyl ester carboxylesterase